MSQKGPFLEQSVPCAKSSALFVPSPAASANLNIAAAAVAGTLNRNENRATSSRLNPRNNLKVIGAPECETSGTRAQARVIPKLMACAVRISAAPWLLRPTTHCLYNKLSKDIRG